MKTDVSFLGGSEIELICSKPHPVRVFDCFTRLNAEQNLVRLGIFLLQIMAIIRRHQGQPESLRLSSINP